MKKTKINFGYIFREDSHGYSDLYRRFSGCFNCLLAPELNDDEYINLCYVQSETEIQLKDCLNDFTDGIYHLIGYTGIGKTTLLCHIMVSHPNCVNPVINENKLYLPTFFDSNVLNNEEIIISVTRKFASYCRFIKEKYNLSILLDDEKHKEQLNESLYEIIKDNKSNLLEYGITENSDFLNDSPRTQIAYLQKSNIFAYYLCMFKLLLNQPEVDINSVILVLDDIESLREEYETEIMDIYYRAYECIKNNVHRKYNVKLVVSGRPQTFRYIRSNNNLKRKFDSYGISNEISIIKPPSLKLIFEKRFDYFKNKLVNNAALPNANSSSWEEAYNFLEYILGITEMNVGEVIYQLNFNNVRESLLSFVKLLCNRMWLQKNIIMEPSFALSINNFNLSPSVLLKAVILGENDFYADNYLVPNIFYSTKFDNYSYYCLIIIQHFIINNSSNNYGISNYNIKKFFNHCIELWGEDICPIMEMCINYLIQKNILLYSIHEDEYENKEISKNDDRKLYLSSKGVRIWQMLENNSVLLECYREDTYRVYDDETYRKLNKYLSQEQILVDLLSFVMEIAAMEKSNISTFKNTNKLDDFQQLFGEELVSRHLLIGIENTIIYFFNAHNRELSEAFKKLLKETKESITNIERL